MCLATPKVFKFWTPTFNAGFSNDALKVFGTQKKKQQQYDLNETILQTTLFTKTTTLPSVREGAQFVLYFSANAINVHV